MASVPVADPPSAVSNKIFVAAYRLVWRFAGSLLRTYSLQNGLAVGYR